jgi:hypothetical protein
MKTITDVLHSEFGKLNAKFRTTSIIHLKDLHMEINEWKRNGLITEKFFKQNYGQFSFKPPVTLPNACSIIIVGIPQKIIPVEFFYNMVHRLDYDLWFDFLNLWLCCKKPAREEILTTFVCLCFILKIYPKNHQVFCANQSKKK